MSDEGSGITRLQVLVLILFGLFGVFFWWQCSDPIPKTGRVIDGKEQTESAVWNIATQCVRKELKAPSTATFGRASRDVAHLGKQRYRVSGFVDSQNSFGAMLRADFVIEVERVGGDKWSCSTPQLTER